MSMFRLTRTIIVAAALGLLAVPAARANLWLSSYSANFVRNFSNTGYGNLICSFDQYGNRHGDLSDSYNCSYNRYYNNTCINYRSGNYASQGTCLVVKDHYGNAYVWNICNWNGKDQIDCYVRNHYFDCYDIEVYGHCDSQSQNPPPCNSPSVSSVPEPTTVIAGALMLLPLGIQGIRQFRRRKQLA